jgi:hypothetical protein
MKEAVFFYLNEAEKRRPNVNLQEYEQLSEKAVDLIFNNVKSK